MRVSVIIPAYNAAKTITQTLQALSRQDFKQGYEVIVVDDGSSDQTTRLVAQFPSVILFTQTNAGPAAARNAGASRATGEFLCFTDSDCVPHTDWISRLIDGFKAPEIAVVCGSYGIANPDNQLAFSIHQEILFRHAVLVPDYPKVFGSYNFAIKKQTFDAVGGFNTAYRCASGEDNDLSYRLLAQGNRIFFERKALVDHYHTTRVAKYLSEQFRHGFWRFKMYADHPQMVVGDNYTFWKDMIEVPWSLACAIILFCVVIGLPLFSVFLFLLASLFIFEIIFAKVMIKNIFKFFFFSYIMFLRAFVRSFGLSTGIAYYISKKIKKISK